MLFSANKSVFLHAQIEGSFKVYYYDLKSCKNRIRSDAAHRCGKRFLSACGQAQQRHTFWQHCACEGRAQVHALCWLEGTSVLCLASAVPPACVLMDECCLRCEECKRYSDINKKMVVFLKVLSVTVQSDYISL